MAVRPVRIRRHGNSISIGIPRPILNYLGWTPDELLIPEVTDDQGLKFRRPRQSDFTPAHVKPFLAVPEPAAKP